MKSPHRKRLADLLAEQPFAGTKLLGFRCTLLEQHTKGKTVREFHKLVQQAHNLRAYAGEKLALELLNKGRNSPAVPALVRMVYALMMTASPGDYLLHRVSWDQAKEVREHVHAMHKKATSASAADQEQTWEATMLYALKWRVDTTMKKGPKTADSE
ncbi:hypothetical protein [Hydrogenophaga sp. BPS33]|uniref:hypothetical protein n=1 Tax=Hydrogenophaga sp. BPS33 TaxID=2651974 RepID=UPI00131FC6F9|nr:hypothetical protein [Hydrogenophaga sp. BPS33]QHE85488.1 hypothetical protein F9K07_11550 [Hydrogenophaga sp. BPS33]